MAVTVLMGEAGPQVRADGAEGEAYRRVLEAYDPARHPVFGLLRHVLEEEDYRFLERYARKQLEVSLQELLLQLSGGTHLDLDACDATERARIAEITERCPHGASLQTPGVAVPEPIATDLMLTLCAAAEEALRWELKTADLRPVPLRTS
ncbi:MAG TPA: hypothetical protein VNO79_10970 [Actinomycetota bacterium]|nr:hypothetical protein [Actinomycetota bacterium]